MNDEGNGKVTIREVYDLVEKSHDELSDKIDTLGGELHYHYKEAAARDLKIQALELFQKSLPENCDRRVNEAIRVEHEQRHQQHMEIDHENMEPTMESISRKVWIMWGIGLFIVTILANGFLMWMLRDLLGS